jgi:lipoyl(octanoyl) transferase
VSDEYREAEGNTAASPVLGWAWLGRFPYSRALALQERLRDGVLRGEDSETLLLVEHPPVITLGRNANPAHVLASSRLLEAQGIDVVHVSRGGDVTFHGPGQLVGYPVFRTRHGVRNHVTAIGRAIIDVLAGLGLDSRWDEAHPGVWIGDDKICAVGIHVRRGVAIHGFALNVSVDLGGFEAIVPCGLRSFGVTSIAKQLGAPPTMEEVASRTVVAFEHCFGLRLQRLAPSDSRLQIANGDL